MRILHSVGIWIAAGGLLVVLGSAARGQTPSGNLPVGTGPNGTNQVPSKPPATPEAPASESGRKDRSSIGKDTDNSPLTEETQAKLRNLERQKLLVADAEKLLSLATELKGDVDKSTKDTLSLDVIRKADEIEKLAHTVKEKMKGS